MSSCTVTSTAGGELWPGGGVLKLPQPLVVLLRRGQPFLLELKDEASTPTLNELIRNLPRIFQFLSKGCGGPLEDKPSSGRENEVSIHMLDLNKVT